MQLNGSIVAALLAGFAIGAVVTGVRAQSTPTAYVVIDVAKITDPVGYANIIANAPAGLVPFGGRYVIRSDKITTLSGPAPQRFVVIAFDSLDRAQRWSESAPAKELAAARARLAKSRAFFVEEAHH
jgi:uncharacterized protein (DUF1330 family)